MIFNYAKNSGTCTTAEANGFQADTVRNYYLQYAAQMFGAGKSRLGEEFVDRATEMYNANDLGTLRPLLNEKSFATLQLLKSDNNLNNAWKELTQAQTVYIDCSYPLLQPPPGMAKQLAYRILQQHGQYPSEVPDCLISTQKFNYTGGQEGAMQFFMSWETLYAELPQNPTAQDAGNYDPQPQPAR